MKTWFITGISRGLGRALAAAALAEGDHVVGTIRGGTVRNGTPDLPAGPGRLEVLTVDLTDGAAAEAAVGEAFARLGRIDVLVNNAGYGLLGAIENASDAEAERLFNVNLFAPFRIIRAALPYLRAQGSGHIVNVTSIAGRAPGSGSGVYAATKYALEGLSASLAQEVGPLGIKVTAVAPGAFRTDFLSTHSIRKSGSADAAYADSVGRMTAAFDAADGRQLGDPDRAARAILAMLRSDDPPLHLLLGSDALQRARAKLAAVTAEIDAWEELTRSTDFPPAD
ncbi:oxidoreductase [Azospirillum picis]|uniref:NAD(P)-dependent dehydrogenase (Short-subunit alcohol dehydrogenase family) n=1 Tax=Azospirillum picis TaxID=488438 RepID=A0ABU0MM10_9PROT|nr:oxidoreductase [Azospirillum picis]MBP2300541.1 NAD(P)-dependent dehydrogenase (short-subunit alcohol dehydrogenase family) [Azospirillum picis]MDQ0534510.1 NAD(P)-dependent dehydrogenase (short-subunit alcohol dehydrogenase family) [Azospirillum picis]